MRMTGFENQIIMPEMSLLNKVKIQDGSVVEQNSRQTFTKIG